MGWVYYEIHDAGTKRKRKKSWKKRLDANLPAMEWPKRKQIAAIENTTRKGELQCRQLINKMVNVTPVQGREKELPGKTILLGVIRARAWGVGGDL